MTSIVKTGLRQVTIHTDTTCAIALCRVLDDYSLETLIPPYTLSDDTKIITYDKDGIYVISLEESIYIDLCVEDIYDHIKTDVADILSTSINENDHTMARYDFMTLLLLGLQFFGNTSYDLLEQSDLPTIIGTDLQYIQDAIVRSKLYTELNASNSQATNI